MATNQLQRLDIYEGILYIHLKAGEALAVGDVVTADDEGEVVKCGTNDIPLGLCAQEVTTAGIADYAPGGLVSHTAKVGDRVGIYICGGVYKVEVADLDYGNEVYAIAGKVTETVSQNQTKVGLVLESTNAATGFAKIKSYL